MRPRIILHMMSTIDGRITSEGWPPSVEVGDIYEAAHRDLGGDAWLVGRVTMAEFAQGAPQPMKALHTYPRQTWRAAAAGIGPYAIYLDGSARLHLNRDRVNGDALIAVLTTSAPDDHLAELRRDGISYIFAGDAEIELDRALGILRAEFGIGTVLLEGGGTVNGAFLARDLIDEISLMILPIADNKPEKPATFNNGNRPAV